MITKFQPLQTERPWGYFRQFCENMSVTVKILVIKPKEMLSLQSHAKREEFWRVIAGQGVAQIGYKQRELKIGDELIVSLGVKHRLMAGPTGLEVLEISSGEFTEDDIIRYKDKYYRV